MNMSPEGVLLSHQALRAGATDLLEMLLPAGDEVHYLLSFNE